MSKLFLDDEDRMKFGLKAVDKLFRRGVLPSDLMAHYLLFHFVESHGNIIKMAKAMGCHRNSIQFHFAKLGISQQSVKMRKTWDIIEHGKKRYFWDHFQIFFNWVVKLDRKSKQIRFTPAETQGLVALWESRVPFKMLEPFFILSRARAKHARQDSFERLEISPRHGMRLIKKLFDRHPSQPWIRLMDAKTNEVYSQ
jgi:hypothetical protein